MNPKSNYIHPTAIIGDNVEMGEGNYIGPYCIIGYPAEHKAYFDQPVGKVKIGNNNHFTGHVTIDAGTEDVTVIGNDCWFLKHSHAGHDVVVGDKVTISCGVKIGGHTIVMDGANIGLNTVIHQKHLVGAYAMIGMGSVVPLSREIQPFTKCAGNPVNEIGKNQKAIDDNHFSVWDFENINQNYLKIKLKLTKHI